MERGEFIKTAEQAIASQTMELVKDQGDLAYIESYIAKHLPLLTLELYGKISEKTRTNEKWATVLIGTKGPEQRELSAVFETILILSDVMQQDGFRTDEAGVSDQGNYYRQLTVFWSDGKEIYEHELHRLGRMDYDLLNQAILDNRTD